MSEAETSSIYQSNLPLETKLERARTELLDLSARNRLLNVPRFSKAARTIDIVDERSTEVYRLLAKDGKAFTFSAGRPDRAGAEAAVEEDEDLSAVELAQPEETEEELDGQSRAKRHIDTKLQTRMTPKGLQKRLLDLYHDARTLEAHRGVTRDGDFLSLLDAEPVVRDRRNSISPGLRKVEMLPPSELAVGVLRIVVDNLGATDEEVVGTLSRMLGFKATSAQLRSTIGVVVAALVEQGRLSRKDRMLVIGAGAVPASPVIEDRPALLN